MPRTRSFLLGAAGVVLTALAALHLHPPHPERPAAVPLTARSASASLEVGAPSRAGLEGIYEPIMEARWYAGVIWHAEMRRQWLEAAAAAERARAAARQRQAPSRRYSTGVTGPCQAMKPPGFPDYIIERESGGDPNVVNEYGYTGCAQLDSDYLTGNYAEDWARLWAGGAGACHWNPPRYCAG